MLTTKAPGAGQNGPIGLSLVMTQVRAAPASLSGAAGSVYDTGIVTANVNGISATASYGQSSTAQTVAQSLAAAISSSGAGVTATAGTGAAITITASQAGPAANGISVTLSSLTDQPTFFSSVSFLGNSSTLSGGLSGSTAGALYQYTIPAAGASVGYDAVGNVKSFSDCQNNVCQAGTWSANYDNLNRLSNVSATAGPWSGLGMSWAYDSLGNRKTQTLTGNPAAGVPQPQTYTFSGQNRIGNYGPGGYDAAGNVSNDLVNNYVYDAEGRICAVAYNNGMTTAYMLYFYDADRSVAKGNSSRSAALPQAVLS